MNENNSNTPDKMRHSDEDYHDITIDWSNESFDYRNQLFHQLAAYTGIPVEYQLLIDVQNPYLPTTGFGHLNPGIIKQRVREYDVNKEYAMESLYDGDCYFLTTELMSFHDDPSIFCCFYLLHSDLVNENGCNPDYCHHLGSRLFSNKLSQFIKSEHLQKLLYTRVDRVTSEAARKSEARTFSISFSVP
uniref:Uncharacterized protein n=1 Tax=Tetranychus urticae TaxID=32264 RepID=T1KX47_TETUR